MSPSVFFISVLHVCSLEISFIPAGDSSLQLLLSVIEFKHKYLLSTNFSEWLFIVPDVGNIFLKYLSDKSSIQFNSESIFCYSLSTLGDFKPAWLGTSQENI